MKTLARRAGLMLSLALATLVMLLTSCASPCGPSITPSAITPTNPPMTKTIFQAGDARLDGQLVIRAWAMVPNDEGKRHERSAA